MKARGLLVHERDDRLQVLKSALEGLGIDTVRTRNCKQAGLHFLDAPPPHIVFTDTVLPDGNWMDVLDLAAKAKERVNLIVVSARADIDLYIDVMNHGAFDYITESFTVPEIVYVVRSSLESAVQARRNSGEHSIQLPGIRRRARQFELDAVDGGRA